MSKLVLSRKAGEAIRLELVPGFFLTVEIQEVNFDRGVRIRLSASGTEQVETVRMGRTLEVIPSINLTVAAIAFKQVRLAIEAPSTVKILRSELIGQQLRTLA